MSRLGDEQDEMRTNPLDDQTIDALLAGRIPASHWDDLAGLVAEVRGVGSGPLPVPRPQLAAILAGGLTIEKGDLPATAASNVYGPAPQASGLPKWRRKPMLETLFAKAVLAKAAAVLTSLTVATAGAAAADKLPQTLQDKAAAAIETVLPVDVPSSSDAAEAQRQDGEKVAEEHTDHDPADARNHDNFGTTVSEQARSGLPKEDGRAFGQNVSDSAPKAPQATKHKAQQATDTDNPGTPARQSAPSARPEHGEGRRQPVSGSPKRSAGGYPSAGHQPR